MSPNSSPWKRRSNTSRHRPGHLARASFAVVSGVMFAASLASHPPPGSAAAPPAFGGLVVISSDAPLATPRPGDAQTPIAASLETSVFDTLYELSPSLRPRPLIAADVPTRDGRDLVIPIREGVTVPRHGPLRASHVVASLERAREGAHAWLLDGVGAIEARDDSIRVTAPFSPLELATRLAARPLAIALPDGELLVGTGPFRVTRRPNGELHLLGQRRALRGAPYLREVRVVPPRDRDAEARAFQLGELHLAFVDPTIFAARGNAVSAPRATRPGPTVLLVPNRARGALASDTVRAALEGVLDRARLRRVGIEPSESLGPELRPWRHDGRAGARAARRVRILIRDGDTFERRMAEALAAQLDAAGFRVRVRAEAPARYAAVMQRGDWELRLTSFFSPIPTGRALVAQAFASTGQNGRARALARSELRSGRDTGSEDVAAWVLGRRVVSAYAQRTVHGLRFGRDGRLRLEEIFRPREIIRRTPPRAGAAAEPGR